MGGLSNKLRSPTALRILWNQSNHSGRPSQSRQTIRRRKSSHHGLSRWRGRPIVNFQPRNPSIIAGLVGVVSTLVHIVLALGWQCLCARCGSPPPVLRGAPLGVARMTKAGSVRTLPKRPAGRPAVPPLLTAGIRGALLKQG